jgi:integrative and conjugative element protein (TIGR02256 family)
VDRLFVTQEPGLPQLQARVARLFLPRALLVQMEAEARSHAPNETGGVMLGTAIDSAVWVEAVIGPGPRAVHRRASFTPDWEDQQREIATAYEQSGRRLAYLGDWHTHPGGGAHLSPTDTRTLRSIARHCAARQPNPIMAVLAGGEPWSASAWRLTDRPWYSSTKRIVSLVIEVS